jgi:hypothetical protein
MIYTIIAEPRSGGVSLMNWVEKSLPNFTISQEPWFIENDLWVNGEDVSEVEWVKKYDNIFIREIYKPTRDFNNLIKISDKVLCLYRDNWEEQIRSSLFQETNEKYLDNYNETDVLDVVTNDMIRHRYVYYFKEHKEKFKQFIKENNFPSVSYENLYYGDGVGIIKKHFNFDTDIEFPLNTRHLKRDGIPVEPQKLKTNFL